MTADLLERDRELAELGALLDETAKGQGRIALISGEAGIGKTALVESFLAESYENRKSPSCILWGACEAFFTPRPLGPLYDIAQQARTSLRAVLDGDSSRASLFAAVLDELAHGASSTILIVEDIHWADEATLDLIKFLARRISRVSAMLILTYRDDELSKGNPLRLVLGDLPARMVTRMRLSPLSEAAVAALAHTAAYPAKDLYRATGGFERLRDAVGSG